MTWEQALAPPCAKSNRDGTILCDRQRLHFGGCSWELAELGYVRGLRVIRGGLRTFDQDLPGFDRATCHKLWRFAVGMVEAAEARRLPQPHHTESSEGIPEAGKVLS